MFSIIIYLNGVNMSLYICLTICFVSFLAAFLYFFDYVYVFCPHTWKLTKEERSEVTGETWNGTAGLIGLKYIRFFTCKECGEEKVTVIKTY